ncbi:MAG: hypothetical protein HFI37_01910 [Lachnospiraceae bacterium]|jgi:uncharacterized HAD superfamily protein|nr:hypothetical protein [Lachnospiraceae bacterium]
MRIGIDIDGVLTNVEQFSMDYFSRYCVERNVEYHIGDSSYEIAKTFGVSDELASEFWDEYLEYYGVHEPARALASEVIKKLKQEGHEIYIITARWRTNKDDAAGKRMRGIVKKWLDENEIVYDQLIFSQAQGERKSQEVQESGVDVMVEDNPGNIAELSEIVPILCYATGYNKECTGDNITRCYSWYDVYEKIRKMDKK